MIGRMKRVGITASIACLLCALPAASTAAVPGPGDPDPGSALERRKRAFCERMADDWAREGYPIGWKHAEWKHDEVEPNWAGALAAMLLKRSAEEVRKADAFFASMPLDEKVDPDMRVCEALHAYHLFRDDPDLGPAARRRLLAVIRFRPAPRRIHPSIWKFGATENHAFMGHVWCLLAAQLDRDRETAETIGRQIDAFILEHIRKGWLEYNSPCYVEKEVGCLVMVLEWAEDPDLRRKARLGLDVLLAEHAALNLEGMLGGPASRVYEPGRDGILPEERNHDSRIDAKCSGSYPLLSILFDRGRPHPYGVLGAPLVATSRYAPPRAVDRLARTAGESGGHECKARRPGRGHGAFRRSPDAVEPPPEAFDARAYAWVTPSFVLGSFQEVEGKFGATRSLPLSPVLRVAGGTRRTIHVDLVPREPPLRDEARIDCFQHKNVVVGRGAVGEARFPVGEFQEVSEREGWIFVRAGPAFVALAIVGSGHTWKRDGEAGGVDLLRFGRPDAPFIIEAAQAEDYGGDFDRFRADVLDNPIRQEEDRLSYGSCSAGRAGPSAEPFEVTLRPGDLPLLDGSPVDLAGYGTFESPFLESAWDSGVVKLRAGPERLTVNVARPRSPIRIEETIRPLALPVECGFDAQDGRWVPFLNYWRLKPEQWSWDPAGGTTGGSLRHESARGVKDPERGAHDAAIILRGGEEWTDYIFEASAMAGGGRIGLWARADLEDEGAGNGRWVQGYSFMIDPGRGRCRLWRARKDGLRSQGGPEGSGPERNDFSNPVALGDAPLPPGAAPGRWIRLRMEVRGNSIRCSAEGQEVIAVEDSVFRSGSVGFIAYKARDARFDDVRVYRP
jgi:hypothetical protein